MSRFTRRSLLKGAAAGAGLATVSSLPGARLIRAQGASYEIVSFGPIGDGVLPEGYFRPQRGGINGIHADGTAFGSTASSEEKLTPTLFHLDGTMTKLKSGGFGGTVNGMNADGAAVGRVYESVAGIDEGNDSMDRPALWIDRELIRLPMLESESSWAGSYASSISDSGAIFGYHYGSGNVVWIDNEPQELEGYNADYTLYTSYLGLTPAGEMIVSRSGSAVDDMTLYGLLAGDEFTEFAVPNDIGTAYLNRVNSRGDALMYATTVDTQLYWISAVGAEPELIDFRDGEPFFTPTAFNADHQIVGWWAPRRNLKSEPAVLRDGEFTLLAELLPADHGFSISTVNGISDDGVISGGGYDADGGFHPLLFVPA